MKDVPVIRGRKYISALVAEGEHEHQDFKFQISDARKIARSVSAFANAGGGRLLIGVKDNGSLAGVRNEEDIFLVEQAAERYCDPPQQVDFKAYSVDTDKIIIIASVAQATMRPVRSQEPDGSWRAYYRVADENIAAHPLMVRAWTAREKSASALRIDDCAARLIAMLDAAPAADAAALAIELGISRRRTENLIVRLAAAGIINFTYRHPHFHLTGNFEF